MIDNNNVLAEVGIYNDAYDKKESRPKSAASSSSLSKRSSKDRLNAKDEY